MWESIFLTLVATASNNIGKVIRAYALNKPWALGFLMDIFGALLMLRALSLAHVSVVQPVSGCGLAILSIFLHFYLKEVMNVFDWIRITMVCTGTIVHVSLTEDRDLEKVMLNDGITWQEKLRRGLFNSLLQVGAMSVIHILFPTHIFVAYCKNL
ncbi:hypothetical protein Bca52824_016562 [Brassica carinata]|uniref:Probable magnesium transporter n=1 Tax=Brassica carinata TaxID=52824 RepID=A0A8X8B472_BRACI|nr:hypothetical protein Bca52824_016562 [Brassica carinata]